MKGPKAFDHEVFDFIISTVKERGRQPTLRQIAQKFGWRSTQSAWNAIQRLVAAGKMRPADGSWGFDIVGGVYQT